MRLHYALEDSSKSPHMEALQRPCRIIHCLLFDHHHYEQIAKSSLIPLARGSPPSLVGTEGLTGPKEIFPGGS